jgi:N-acetylglucosaminyl-diphospho-decaprenol L-rhamnosyltransferase
VTQLSIVIVNWNTRELLGRCLRAISDAALVPAGEVIVVDNASSDGSLELVYDAFPDVRVIGNTDNRGFGAANNQALRVCSGEFALLLNSDALLRPGAVEAMLELLRSNPRAGMCACRLVDEGGRPLPSASNLPGLAMQAASFLGLKALVSRRLALRLVRLPVAGRILSALSSGYFVPLSVGVAPQRVDFLSGACLLVRRAVWEDIGLLDEKIFLYLEDADWCRRAGQAGWELYYLPAAEVVHLAGSSFRVRSGGRTYHLSRERCESLLYYFRKHHSVAAVGMLKLLLVVSLGARCVAAQLRVALRGDVQARQEAARLLSVIRTALDG